MLPEIEASKSNGSGQDSFVTQDSKVCRPEIANIRLASDIDLLEQTIGVVLPDVDQGERTAWLWSMAPAVIKGASLKRLPELSGLTKKEIDSIRDALTNQYDYHDYEKKWNTIEAHYEAQRKRTGTLPSYEVLVEHYLRGDSQDQTAREHNVPLQTVCSGYRRIRTLKSLTQYRKWMETGIRPQNDEATV